MTPTELLESVRRVEVRTNRLVNDVMVGAYLSHFKGRGMDFEDLREYMPDDDVRDIDWNVTKREFAAEVAATLAISAARNGDKVALLLFTDEVELFLPARKGRRHILRLV